MKKLILLSFVIITAQQLSAQQITESLQKSEMTFLHIVDAIYSETTAKAVLADKRILIGGFHYQEDKVRKSTLLLYDENGNSLQNGYKTGFLSYFLFGENENFINDIKPIPHGGAYVLGSSAYSNYYTGYLLKVNNDAILDEGFMLPHTDDTGFIRIHSYDMVAPNTTDLFQTLSDTTYCEPQNILVQQDGKILIVGVTRKQQSEDNYEDGESFVMRLLPNGELDKSYGVAGIAHINLSDKCDDVRTAMLDQEGNVLMYGLYNHSYVSSSVSQFAQSYIVKIDTEGQIDRSFADNGVYVFELPRTVSNPVAIVQQRDGSLLCFSNREKHDIDGRYYYGAAILKLNRYGKRDMRFFDKGVQILTKMGIGFLTDVQATAEHKWLLCGTNQNKIGNHLEDSEELLRSEPSSDTEIVYSDEELEREGAVGFSIRLNEDGSLDGSYPKNGCFFIRKNDMRQKLFFSKVIPISSTNYLFFGAGNGSSSLPDISFMKMNMVSALDFGRIQDQRNMELSFFPNPVKDRATANFQLEAAATLSLQLLDVQGKTVQSFFESKSFEPGAHKLSLRISQSLAKGIYILRLASTSTAKSIKVIVE